ncbi:MAG: acyl-CoA desaturase [Planctomycetota bacterium]
MADAPELDVPVVAHEDHHEFTLIERGTVLLAIALPFVATVLAVVLLWGGMVNLWWLALAGGFYFITTIGITVGYHRMITHKSFDAGPLVRLMFAVFGSLSLEGPCVQWAAIHRRHHRHSDHEEDPHSPHAYGGGFWGVVRGFWHAHTGWMLRKEKYHDFERWSPDLLKDRVLMRVNNLFWLWATLTFLLPAAIGGLVTMSWAGFGLGLLWGGLVRVFLVHHVTWCVNSICHIWGTAPYKSHDESRNNAVVGVLAFGEGWHNNHHAFPASARHGLKWWQLDIAWITIRTLEKLGLVWNVRVPTPERLKAKERVAA